VRAAVTVSSLGPRRSNPGFVVVIDDLNRPAPRAEGQRLAGSSPSALRTKIKNPLTPIQLSAQRLLRYLNRTASAKIGAGRSEFEKLVAECAGLIEREVQTLESLVDEFSQFARFPAAKLAITDLNTVVESAVELFPRSSGRHYRTDGISRIAAACESGPRTPAARFGESDRQRRRSHGRLVHPATARCHEA